MRAAKRLEDMSRKISHNEMPSKKYEQSTPTRLTESQCKELTNWLDAEAARAICS